jgi:hypothetical protein
MHDMQIPKQGSQEYHWLTFVVKAFEEFYVLNVL